MKKHVLINAALIAGTLAAGAGISWLVCQLNRPVVVAFNMKSTVDAFFDSAGRRSLDEAQTKALSDRFNASLEASLRDWQVRLPWCRGRRISRVKSRLTWPAG
mgnify:CR=1 FL=1